MKKNSVLRSWKGGLAAVLSAVMAMGLTACGAVKATAQPEAAAVSAPAATEAPAATQTPAATQAPAATEAPATAEAPTADAQAQSAVEAAAAAGAQAGAAAAVDATLADAYNEVLFNQKNQGGFSAVVEENVTSELTGIGSSKKTELQASGLDSEENLKVIMKTTTTEGEKTDYYSGKEFYTTSTKLGNIKTPMSVETLAWMVNDDVYLSLTADALSEIYSDVDENGDTVYTVAATDETLAAFKKLFLDDSCLRSGSKVDSMSGSLTVGSDGTIKARTIDMKYTIKYGDGFSETFRLVVKGTFEQYAPGYAIQMPDLSNYQETNMVEIAEIQPSNKKIKTTDDICVRATGSLEGRVIGTAKAGTTFETLGVTTDGWTEVSNHGRIAYVYTAYTTDGSENTVKTGYIEGIVQEIAGPNIRIRLDNGNGDLTFNTQYATFSASRAICVGDHVGINFTTLSDVYYRADKVTLLEQLIFEGTVTEYDASHIMLTMDDGSMSSFEIGSYTVIESSDGINIGDRVIVTYKVDTTQGGGVTQATNIRKVSGTTPQPTEYYVEGDVQEFDSNHIMIQADDDSWQSFEVGNYTAIQSETGIGLGDRVGITYTIDDTQAGGITQAKIITLIYTPQPTQEPQPTEEPQPTQEPQPAPAEQYVEGVVQEYDSSHIMIEADDESWQSFSIGDYTTIQTDYGVEVGDRVGITYTIDDSQAGGVTLAKVIVDYNG